jgi:hypothetical protein
VFFELASNTNLLGIGRLAEQNVDTRSRETIRGRLFIAWLLVRNRRFFSHDVQKRPRQIFAGAEIGKNAFDCGSETQSASAKKDNRVAANVWIGLLAVRSCFFDELSARRKLDDQAP